MRRISLIALFVCLALGLAQPARLCADNPGEKGQTSTGEAAKKAPAEQKDMFGFSNWLDLTIWTWVVFLLLFFVLARFAWKPMLEGLKKREQNIAKAIEDAERARQETRDMQAVLQARMNEASQKVSEMLAEGRRDVEAMKQQLLADAQTEIHRERERLHRELQIARDQALQELWHQTAQLATLISTKAIRRQLTVDDHRRLVDEALNEFRQAGKDHQRQIASVQ
jgi:F-type H+-transporting ATPase subunit b